MSLNPAHGKVYSIQHYLIKFDSDLWQVGGFLPVLRFPPPIKLTARFNRNIVESGVKHHNTHALKHVQKKIDKKKDRQVFKITYIRISHVNKI